MSNLWLNVRRLVRVGWWAVWYFSAAIVDIQLGSAAHILPSGEFHESVVTLEPITSASSLDAFPDYYATNFAGDSEQWTEDMWGSWSEVNDQISRDNGHKDEIYWKNHQRTEKKEPVFASNRILFNRKPTKLRPRFDDDRNNIINNNRAPIRRKQQKPRRSQRGQEKEQRRRQMTSRRAELNVGRDLDARCCWWALQGGCDENVYWMRPNCQKSCGTTGCTSLTAKSCQVRRDLSGCPHKWVIAWQTSKMAGRKRAGKGRRRNRRGRRTRKHSVTLNLIRREKSGRGRRRPRRGWFAREEPICGNRREECNYWAFTGECQVNRSYMAYYCRLACKLC